MKNWQYIKLRDAITYIIGGDWGKEPDFFNDDLVLSHVIRATDLKNWNEDRGQYAALRKIDKLSLGKRQLKQGDIIFEISGGSANQPVGRAILINQKVISSVKNPIICSNFFRLIRFTQFLKPEFVNYYLMYAYIKGDIELFQKNTTNIRNFQFSDFENSYTIPIPTISEQTQIVNILDKIFEKFEISKKQLVKIPRLLERYRQSVLERAVSGELTEDWREENNVEFNWESKRLEQICFSITDGDHQSPPKTSSGIPFIVISNMIKGKISFENTMYVHQSYYENLKENKKPQKNDILLAVVGSIGNAVLLDNDKPFSFQRHIALIRPNINLVLPKFLYYQMISKSVINILKDNSKGVAQQTLNLSSLRMINVVIPSLPEQTEIVNRVQKLLKKADEAEAKYNQAMQMIDKLQTSVLAMAFRGELSESQPNDEPVSVLLEKIKTEKARLEQQRKELQKSQTLKKRTMAKQEKVIKSVLDLLKESETKSKTVEEVWKDSEYFENKEVELFYEKLVGLYDTGQIDKKFDDDNIKTLLTLKENAN